MARIEWQFPSNQEVLKYDSRYMTLQRGQEQLRVTEEVHLVIAPRMVKRGRSTGRDFEMENQLLPMEVSLKTSTEQGDLWF